MTLGGHDGGGCREEEPNHKQISHDQILFVSTVKLPPCPLHSSTHVMNDPRPSLFSATLL